MDNKDIVGIGAVSRALESATKEVRELMHKFLSPAAEEAGQLFADRIRVARITNIAKLLTKAKAKLDNTGLRINPVALKTFLPILEGCSLEEDEEMIERWSNLLSSAASSTVVLPTYARILAELTPQEARMVDKIFRLSDLTENLTKGIAVSELRKLDLLDEQQFQAALLNLQVLRLLERKFEQNTILMSSVPFAIKDADLVGLTLFGKQFAKAIGNDFQPK